MGTLADRIREARKEKGLGMNELDRLIGQGSGYTTRLEAGEKTRPDPKVLAKVALALDVRLDWLLSGDGPRRAPDIFMMTEHDGSIGMLSIEAKMIDPPVGTFLLKLDRLPGLRAWVEEHPTRLRLSELAKGIAIYEDVKPASRSDGQPLNGWESFFDDALNGRLTRAGRGDVAAAEALERSQLSRATRRRLRSAPKKR